MALQVAIVGVGNIGNRHAQVYTKHPQARLVAVCDIIKERADRAAERYDARAFYSVKDMLASDIQIDAVKHADAAKRLGDVAQREHGPVGVCDVGGLNHGRTI